MTQKENFSLQHSSFFKINRDIRYRHIKMTPAKLHQSTILIDLTILSFRMFPYNFQ